MASCPGVFCAEEHPTMMSPTRTNRECFSIRSPLRIGTVWNEPSLGQVSYGCASASMQRAASEPSVGMAGGSLADLNYWRWRDAIHLGTPNGTSRGGMFPESAFLKALPA